MGWSSPGSWGSDGGWSRPVGPALWTPALFPNVVALWDAAAGITQSGGNVSAWTPSIGPGFATSQATSGSQPTYSATARNGAPGLTFSGAQSLLGGPNGLPANDTVSFVFTSFYMTAPTATNVIFTYGRLGTGTLRTLYINTSGQAQGSDGGNNYVGAAATGIDACIAWTFGAENSTLIVNSGTPAVATASSLSTDTISGGVHSYIGCYANSSAFATGVIKTILVGSSAPSTSDRQKLEGWDSWHTGLAGSNLPSGHPFKSRAPLTTD